MAFQLLRGGFKLSVEDEELLNRQKVLTRKINDNFVQVGAVFLKPASKNPIDEDWYNKIRGNVDLQSWVDNKEQAVLNVGFNLNLGWMDVDIDAEDPEYNKFIISAMRFIGVDTRFTFGRQSVGIPTHALVQLPEDESANFDYFSKFEPKLFRLNGKHYHVQLRSFPTNTTEKNIVRSAKQTVVPGSVYAAKSAGERDYDISVWYAADGIKVARELEDIANTTPRRGNFTSVVRAISFGTIAYLLRNHWVEGNRQATANKITGWLARVVKDSQAINEHEIMSKEVFCPIDNDGFAEQFIKYVCHAFDDDESHMRIRTYHDAAEKLRRNSDAKIPGWPALQELLGAETVHAIRGCVAPGNDVSALSKMVERYVYDETDNRYIDRQRHVLYQHFAHEAAELERRHKSDTIFIGGKPREAFKVFESSNLRQRVGFRDMFPDLQPGAIFRIGVTGETIPDDVDEPAQVIYNTWKGWPIAPHHAPDDAKMSQIVAMLDRLLGLLTRDNIDQMDWIKDWISWIFQNPGQKQQIAWVCIGGMGTGKSFFGNVFMKALMTDRLWGSASGNIIDQKFNIAPFKDKMFVFIDEAKFGSETGTEEIKKLIRNIDVSGMEKYEDARNYRIFARIMFASNKPDMRIAQRDVRDRALFYTRAWDAKSRGITEIGFRQWAEGLKAFFDQFGTMLKEKDTVAYLLRYFHNRRPDRYKIESIRYSSSSDADIAEANMSWQRRVAKSIIESGYVIADDIDWGVPFARDRAVIRIQEECDRVGVPRIDPALVLHEFLDNGIWAVYSDSGKRGLRPVHRWGDSIRIYQEATGLALEPYREPEPDETGENTEKFGSRTPRKGAKPSLSGKY